MNVAVALVFVADHGKHLRQGAIYTVEVTIAARVVGACR